MSRRCAALEDLDDDHATAAAWAARLGLIAGGSGGRAVRFCNSEQLTRACDVVVARAAGEQAIVADAVEALRQDVDQEPADELVCGERHMFASISALDAVVFPLEGDGHSRKAIWRAPNALPSAQ